MIRCACDSCGAAICSDGVAIRVTAAPHPETNNPARLSTMTVALCAACRDRFYLLLAHPMRSTADSDEEAAVKDAEHGAVRGLIDGILRRRARPGEVVVGLRGVLNNVPALLAAMSR